MHTDTTIQGLFTHGFREGCALWRAGWTAELISHDADASPHGRGRYAASEALMGWLDIAEREARAHGLTQEAAERLVSESK